MEVSGADPYSPCPAAPSAGLTAERRPAHPRSSRFSAVPTMPGPSPGGPPLPHQPF